jgi:proline racemase
MCGHGTIGLVVSLAAEGLLAPGPCRIETPVGVVAAELHPDGGVSVRNVPSHRAATGVAVDVPGVGRVRGDVAWGGNWFFLVTEPHWELSAHPTSELVRIAGEIRRAVNRVHPLVDHVELFGPPLDPRSHSRNFVLCPGGQYDRSPCGTGTSAKLACLAADGRLAPGAEWIQESILGTTFTARYEWASAGDADPRAIIPTITGRASVTARGELVLDPADPFCWGRRDGA